MTDGRASRNTGAERKSSPIPGMRRSCEPPRAEMRIGALLTARDGDRETAYLVEELLGWPGEVEGVIHDFNAVTDPERRGASP